MNRYLLSLAALLVMVLLAFGSADTSSNPSGSGGGAGGGSTQEGNKISAREQPSEFIADKLRSTVDNISVVVNDYFDDPEQKIILVRWDIGDNLTEGMIRLSAKSDVADILRTIGESGINCREVTVFGSFPLVDKFGHSSKDVVVKASYKGATIKRINWDQVLIDNMYEIADEKWFHPTFRE